MSQSTQGWSDCAFTLMRELQTWEDTVLNDPLQHVTGLNVNSLQPQQLYQLTR